MKNEIAVIDSIEKRLRVERKPIIFPLTPTHRRELRNLKKRNIGNLREQLNNIRALKQEEYVKKYSENIAKEFLKCKKNVVILNNNWLNIVQNINDLIDKRIEFENKIGIEPFSLETGYNDICKLDHVELKRIFVLDEIKKSKLIAIKQFNIKFGNKFDSVNTIIEKLNVQYEEAINFGDLEIVKKLYYDMKDSDKFFTVVSNFKV